MGAKILFYGKFHYGLYAAALAFATKLSLGANATEPFYYVSLFCATVFYYNLPHLFKTAAPRSPLETWQLQNAKLVSSYCRLMAACFLVGTVGLYKLNGTLFYWIYSIDEVGLLLLTLSLFGIITYNIDRWTKLPLPNMRSSMFLKPLSIGAAWANATVLLPVLMDGSKSIHNHATMQRTYLQFLETTIYITALSVLFDIKDIEQDKTEGTKTIPVIFGKNNTIALGIALFVLGMIIKTLMEIGRSNLDRFDGLLILAVYFFPIVVSIFLLRDRKFLFYLLYVDGCLLFKALIHILSTLKCG